MKKRLVPDLYFPCGKGFLVFSGGEWTKLESLASRNGGILAVPVPTMTLQPFSFPFRNIARIREALTLRYRQYLGTEEGDVAIFPTVFSREEGQARGIAWMWNRRDMEPYALWAKRGIKIWPLPLPFLGGAPEDGAALFVDSQGVVSMRCKDGEPLFLRTLESSEEEEKTWYAKGGISLEALKVFRCTPDLSLEDQELLEDSWYATWQRYPQLHDLDLSYRGVDALLAWDRALTLCRRSVAGFVLCGVLFALGGWGSKALLLRQQRLLDQQERDLFVRTFGSEHTIRDPLSQARGALSALRGGGGEGASSAPSLYSLLGTLGVAWENAKAGEQKIRFESLRYSQEGVEILGYAPDVQGLQNIRQHVENEGLKAELDDIQKNPEGDIRFSLRLFWKERS